MRSCNVELFVVSHNVFRLFDCSLEMINDFVCCVVHAPPVFICCDYCDKLPPLCSEFIELFTQLVRVDFLFEPSFQLRCPYFVLVFHNFIVSPQFHLRPLLFFQCAEPFHLVTSSWTYGEHQGKFAECVRIV